MCQLSPERWMNRSTGQTLSGIWLYGPYSQHSFQGHEKGPLLARDIQDCSWAKIQIAYEFLKLHRRKLFQIWNSNLFLLPGIVSFYLAYSGSQTYSAFVGQLKKCLYTIMEPGQPVGLSSLLMVCTILQLSTQLKILPPPLHLQWNLPNSIWGKSITQSEPEREFSTKLNYEICLL